jgi:hypothetical protein
MQKMQQTQNIQALSLLTETQTNLPIVYEEIFELDSPLKPQSIIEDAWELVSEEEEDEEWTEVTTTARTTAKVGLHLFVMCHGYQGNHEDMR